MIAPLSRRVASCPVAAGSYFVQFEPLIRQPAITNEQVDTEIQTAINEKRAGLIYFHYEQIMSNAEKQRVVVKYRTV